VVILRGQDYFAKKKAKKVPIQTANYKALESINGAFIQKILHVKGTPRWGQMSRRRKVQWATPRWSKVVGGCGKHAEEASGTFFGG